MLTRKAFYEDFGIFSAEQLTDPLTLVKYSDKLDVIEGGTKRSWMRRFAIHNVKESFGLSINEFWQTPYSEAKFMMEIAESNKLGVDVAKLSKELEK